MPVLLDGGVALLPTPAQQAKLKLSGTRSTPQESWRWSMRCKTGLAFAIRLERYSRIFPTSHR
jgi:hypothetical protein